MKKRAQVIMMSGVLVIACIAVLNFLSNRWENPARTPHKKAGIPESPEAGTTEPPEAGTAESPAAGTTELPEAGTAESPEAGTAESPEADTADSSEEQTPEVNEQPQPEDELPDDPLLAIVAKVEDPVDKVRVLGNLALANLHGDEAVPANALLMLALDIIEGLEDVETKLGVIKELSASLRNFKEVEQLAEFRVQSSLIAEQLKIEDDPIISLVANVEAADQKVAVLARLAGTLAQNGDNDKAAMVLAKAVKITGSIADKACLATALAHMAVAQGKTGLSADAKSSLANAVDTAGKIKTIDGKVAALESIIVAINESNDQEQVQIVLAQSVAVANAIQEHASVVIQQALRLLDRLEDGKQRASAMQQIALAVEKTGGIGDFTGLQFQLGTLYHEGSHLEKDAVRAATCYHQAAALGHAGAQVALALMHLEGDGIEADPVEAFRWLAQAAVQGDVEGQLSLGLVYALGRGVESDLVQAHKWITLAAAQKNPEAKDALKQLTAKLTAEQVELSNELVKQWQARHASSPKAQSAKEPEPTASDGQ